MWRILSSVETFIQYGDFYPVRRLLSSEVILSGAETFIQWADFYLVWRLLSGVETFFMEI